MSFLPLEHSFTLFLVTALRIFLEEILLPQSVHVLVWLLPLPLPVGPRGGHITQALPMRSLNTLVAVTGSGMAPDPRWNYKEDPRFCWGCKIGGV